MLENIVDPKWELESEMKEALVGLTVRQQRFAMALPTADTLHDAAIAAGYVTNSKQGLRSFGSRLARDPRIRRVTNLAMQLDMLKNGIGIAWKRKELVELFVSAKREKEHSAANSIMRTLAQIDGDLQPESTVNVNVNTLPEIRDITPEELETVSRVYREMRGLNAPKDIPGEVVEIEAGRD